MKNEDVLWEVWGRAQLLFTVTNLWMQAKLQSEHLLDSADANHGKSPALLKEIKFEKPLPISVLITSSFVIYKCEQTAGQLKPLLIKCDVFTQWDINSNS